MRKRASWAALAVFAMAASIPATARQAVRAAAGHGAAVIRLSQPLGERDGLYVHAAGVITRAGVASPYNGPLSREEILSILVLMSLQQQPPPASHAS